MSDSRNTRGHQRLKNSRETRNSGDSRESRSTRSHQSSTDPDAIQTYLSPDRLSPAGGNSGDDMQIQVIRRLQKDAAENSANATANNISVLSTGVDAENPSRNKANAEKMQNEYKNPYIFSLRLMEMVDFCTMGNQLYAYDDKQDFWILIDNSQAYRTLRKIVPEDLKYSVTTNLLKEVYECLVTEAKEIPASQYANHKTFLNFENVALDWQTETVIEDRKPYFFRYHLQVRYEKKKKKRTHTGCFDKFINDLFGTDAETKREFFKFLGLCLSEIRDLKYAFFLYGPSNTGKSVLMNLLRKLVGARWTSTVSFAQMSDEFAAAQLLGKRLNISGEVSGATNRRADIFKSLTGNDTISVRFLFREFFSLKSECLLVFGCNNFPEIKDSEAFDAIVERIIIFPFFHVAERGEDWIEDLDQKLFEDSDSVITAAIDGLHYLAADNYIIRESHAMLRCKQDYIAQFNSFLLFARKFITADADAKIHSETIEQAYGEFCKEENLHQIYSNQWTGILKQLFPVRSISFGEPRRRGYKGIRLNSKNPDFSENNSN